MDREALKVELKSCSDDKKFFDILEKCVEFRIPLQIKKILKLHMCNSAVSLSRNILQSIDEIEHFMRNNFSKRMLASNEKMSDYLGIFESNQQNFIFMSGQKRMLSVINEYCRQLYPFPENVSQQSSSTQNVSTQNLSSHDVQNSVGTLSIKQHKSVTPIDQEAVLKTMYDKIYVWMKKQNGLSEV